MKTYNVQYPGDPPSKVVEMSRKEFQDSYRPSHYSITDLITGEIETIPIGEEEINCDGCNINPYDTIYVHLYGKHGCRAYCKQCWERTLKPYVR